MVFKQMGRYRTKGGYLVTLYDSFVDVKTGQRIWWGSRPGRDILYYLPDGKLDTERNGTDSQQYTLIAQFD